MTLANSPLELEIRRLAAVLHLPVDALSGLEAIGLADLRTLRGQINAKLFDEGADSWERAVAVAGIVPSGLSAKLAEHALGPVLTARVTAHTPAAKANDIGAKLSPEFMADVAVGVDPRHIGDLVVAMPADRVAAIGRVLADREEWLVMADFVAAIPAATLTRTIAALPDAALMHIMVLIEDPERITAIVALLDEERLQALRAVASAQDLDAHLAFVLDSVDEAQRARLTAA